MNGVTVNVPQSPRENSSTAALRVGFVTMGCKVNSYESAQVAQSLKTLSSGAGEGSVTCKIVSPKEPADAVVINTCTVTGEADRQARQEIRRVIRRNPNALVVVTGCYAQMDPSACAQIPGVDYVVGNARKLDLPNLLPGMLDGTLDKISLEDVNEHTSLPSELLHGFEGRSRAFLQIQQGCDQGCTFCIIHVARGKSRSIASHDVLRQAERLVMNGYRELVICGVDLGAYGDDLRDEFGNDPKENVSLDRENTPAPDPRQQRQVTGERLGLESEAGVSLASLLTQLNGIDGDFRIRLSSLDPAHITDELIDAWSTLNKVCPHLHLSLQSGNTLILKRMKRRYDRPVVDERIARLRLAVPNLTISADIMVGFPTETEEHFGETLTAVEQLQIAWPHTFMYSPRQGTPAARIPRQISAQIKKTRATQVRERAEQVRKRQMQRRVGERVRLLCEAATGRHGIAAGLQRGRADDYSSVFFPADGQVAGEFVDARITGVIHGEDEGLLAEIVS